MIQGIFLKDTVTPKAKQAHCVRAVRAAEAPDRSPLAYSRPLPGGGGGVLRAQGLRSSGLLRPRV